MQFPGRGASNNQQLLHAVESLSNTSAIAMQ